MYVPQHKWDARLKRMIPTGGVVLSNEGRECKNHIMATAKRALHGIDWDYEYTKTGFLYMNVTIYFNRKGRDDDDIYKALKDALQGVVYENDSRVLVRTDRVFYDKDNPRVEVEFEGVPYIGIFDGEGHLNKFIEGNCSNCRRFKNNCSLLAKAKEGYIQQEIANDKCSSMTILKTKKKPQSID